MSYEKKISQQYPGLIALALDDSGSMRDHLPGTSNPKYEWVERYTGIILDLLLERSSEVRGDEVKIKPRYYQHITKYGSTTRLWNESHMDIETTIRHFTDSGDSLGLSGNLGGTDAKRAFKEAYDFLKGELLSEKYRDSFPPMVFHLTDGESHTDATQIAEKIKQLSTTDGNVLVVNAYIGTQTSLNYEGPEDFPGYVDASEAGPGRDNIRLFEMSSQAPDCIVENLKADGTFPQFRTGARLFFDVRTKEMLKNVIQVIGSMGSRMER